MDARTFVVGDVAHQHQGRKLSEGSGANFLVGKVVMPRNDCIPYRQGETKHAPDTGHPDD